MCRRFSEVDRSLQIIGTAAGQFAQLRNRNNHPIIMVSDSAEYILSSGGQHCQYITSSIIAINCGAGHQIRLPVLDPRQKSRQCLRSDLPPADRARLQFIFFSGS
jgi:hypothetical protein